MLWDLHMHTHFSGDSDATPESMIQAAMDAGLSGLCFTDHLDYDYWKDPELFLLDIDAYLAKCRQLQENLLLREKTQPAVEGPGAFSICTGIELGLQPHLASRLWEITGNYSFDFIIASSHAVKGVDPCYPDFFAGKTEDEAYEEYFASILENIAVFDDFDVYGHIDYVVRYGPNRNRFYSYQKFREIIDEILKALISRGKGIELNTGGFKYGLGHPNPSEDILKRYRELGGEIITIGADAHKPEHVAYAFDKVPEILKEAGFKYFTVFKKRQPEFLLL